MNVCVLAVVEKETFLFLAVAAVVVSLVFVHDDDDSNATNVVDVAFKNSE